MSANVLESKAAELTVHNGLGREDRQNLAKLLSRAVADTYLLFIKTQGFHWNVTGPLFYSLHKLTEEQYQDLYEAADGIAERIRAIGFPAPGSYHQFVELSSIEEERGIPSADDMIRQLVEGNGRCARSMREAALEADRLDDVFTHDLLTSRVGRHEENAWMLNAILVRNG